MRGRVMALWAIVFLGSTPIGAPLTGLVAAHFGARAALGMGAVATLLDGGLGRGRDASHPRRGARETEARAGERPARATSAARRGAGYAARRLGRPPCRRQPRGPPVKQPACFHGLRGDTAAAGVAARHRDADALADRVGDRPTSSLEWPGQSSTDCTPCSATISLQTSMPCCWSRTTTVWIVYIPVSMTDRCVRVGVGRVGHEQRR